MTDFQTIHYSVSANGQIGTLTIDRPEALNALSTQVLSELEIVIDQIAQERTLRVLVITGAGRSFVAGADIAEMVELTPEEALAFGERGARVFRKVELLYCPVIAAVNGFALGGGCELSLACDLRIASDKAKFGQPEVGLGIPPGFSGTQRLPRLIGAGAAKELIYTARVVKADEALTLGLVNRIVESDALMSTVTELAEEIASKSPHAVAISKRAINRGLQSDIDTGIAIENDLFSNAFAHPEQREGMSAFLEKRKPQF